MPVACPHCGCSSADGARSHALLALLADDDVDAALQLGLLQAMGCANCQADCNVRLAAAREVRGSALAARERHCARAHRLAQRQAARDTARMPPASFASPMPALPDAAAEALARALAKARSRKPT